MKTKNIFTKILLLAMLITPTFTLTSCSKDDEYVDEPGIKMFTNPNKDDVNIYFLNGDEISLKGGKKFDRTSFGGNDGIYKNINSSESYIIKSGNTEMLVDCGHQLIPVTETGLQYPYRIYNSAIQDNTEFNLIRKIASICEDGILEYLVVTHADFDHIGSLVFDGCLFDAFLREQTVKNFNDEDVKLKQIKNIIDFDSPVVALHSYDKIVPKKRLIGSVIYQRYRVLREMLTKKRENSSNHVPASALFLTDSVVEESKLDLNNKNIAFPFEPGQLKVRPLTEFFPNEAAAVFADDMYKNHQFKGNVAKLGGELKVQNDRFYYELPFGSGRLKFLYQWFYDFAQNHGFETDSQARNNISVCFVIERGSNKFAAFGDLGGLGEKSILRYYKGTNILSHVKVFKASHHGSVTNGENSVELYKMLKPKFVIIPGCFQHSMDAYSYIRSAAYIKQGYLDNIYEVYGDDFPKILYTNILSRATVSGNEYIRNAPFYGDIHICLGSENVSYSCSYIGDIKPYINKKFHDDYKVEHKKDYTFKTKKKDGLKGFIDLELLEKVNLTYGEKDDEE